MKLRTAGRPVRLPVRGRVLAALGGVLVVPLVLSGCAAGQRAQTANEFSVVGGITGNVGMMGIRDAGISAPKVASGYAARGNATLTMVVVNNGDSADSLVSVTSPNAASATIAGPRSAAPIKAGVAGAAAIDVPANGAVSVGLGTGSATITLKTLKYRLVPGQSVPVTLTFQSAGAITVMMPVMLVAGQTGGETADVAPTTGLAN